MENMKKYSKAVLICIALMLSPQVFAGGEECQFKESCTFKDWHDPWTDADTYRQAAYLTLVYLDYRQTVNDMRDHPEHIETNRILGEHPSKKRVTRFVIGGALLHTGISYVLPKEFRGPFQYISITAEAVTIYHNYRLGIDIRF